MVISCVVTGMLSTKFWDKKKAAWPSVLKSLGDRQLLVFGRRRFRYGGYWRRFSATRLYFHRDSAILFHLFIQLLREYYCVRTIRIIVCTNLSKWLRIQFKFGWHNDLTKTSCLDSRRVQLITQLISVVIAPHVGCTVFNVIEQFSLMN